MKKQIMPLENPKTFIKWIRRRLVLNEEFEKLIEDLEKVAQIYNAIAKYKYDNSLKLYVVSCTIYWEEANSEVPQLTLVTTDHWQKREILLKDTVLFSFGHLYSFIPTILLVSYLVFLMFLYLPLKRIY